MDRIRLSKIAVLFKRGIYKFYAKDVVVGVKSRVMLFVFFRKGIPFSSLFSSMLPGKGMWLFRNPS